MPIVEALTDEEAPADVRDPVRCRACLIEWIGQTRLMLDAIEAQMAPAALPTVVPDHPHPDGMHAS